ncbi:MAG: iron transporter, partial [Synergistaceae bacterium]|nr:iron transporter [Synergistaceae bacterium]
MKKCFFAVLILALALSGAAFGAQAVSVKPGQAGFEEIPIGETQAGPYNVAAVYFQAVDMY